MKYTLRGPFSSPAFSTPKGGGVGQERENISRGEREMLLLITKKKKKPGEAKGIKMLPVAHKAGPWPAFSKLQVCNM